MVQYGANKLRIMNVQHYSNKKTKKTLYYISIEVLCHVLKLNFIVLRIAIVLNLNT